MNERRGSRPLVGREKKHKRARCTANGVEWRWMACGRKGPSSPALGTVMAITTNVRVDHQCREMTSHLSVGLEQSVAT